MYKKEISRLENKLLELKRIYESRKNKREKLVNEIETIDKLLEELKKVINITKEQVTDNEVEIHNAKLKNKANIKSCIKQYIKYMLITNLGLILLNFIILEFKYFITQLVAVLITQIALSAGDYLKIREKVPKENIISKRNLENKEKEYQDLLNRRLTIGQKYKTVREKEISAYNVYKITEQLVTERINYLNETQTSYSDNNSIYMNDIYYKIMITPMEHFESSETKKRILDEQLKKYIIEKISEINYTVTKTSKLNDLTTEELVTVLSNYIPKNNHDNTISHIIHAILGYASNMQSHSIVWIEEDNEDLIKNPTITYDEQGRWNELKTHKNTDYITIFNKVYNEFLNNFMIEEKIKNRAKQNN